MELTSEAARRIIDLREERGDAACLRIGVEKGGCAGMQYVMEFDERRPEDSYCERDGAGVVVAPDAVPYLDGSVVDYVDDLAGAGFRLRNPNAARSCGCGTSFETASSNT